MGHFKKSISTVLAIVAVLTIATSTMCASAGHWEKTWKQPSKEEITNLGEAAWDAISTFLGINKKDDKDTTAPEDTKAPEEDAAASTDEQKKNDKKGGFSVHVDYEVTRHLKFHFGVGEKDEPTEPVVIPDDETPLAPAPASEPAPAPAAEPVVFNDVETPKGEIPATGDTGIAAVAALSLVSAAAFVVAKKK